MAPLGRLADARFALHPPTPMMRGWDIFFIPGKSWWWMIEGWPEISGDLSTGGGYPLVNFYKQLWKDPPFLMGKLTISMAIFNSYVSLPEGNDHQWTCPGQFMVSAGFTDFR